MKQSLTIEQVAENLSTTPELAKDMWMQLVVKENGYEQVGDKYILSADLKRVKKLQSELLDADFADEDELKQNSIHETEIKKILSSKVDLQTAFNNINK